MIFKVMRNKKPLILGIVLSILMITALSVFKYADKMYREYNNTPLTIEIIQKELALMTTGAVLPNGNWSYGIDISHHQPLVRWKKLRILINLKRTSYGNWRYWQFTDKGLVRGIGPVDINIKRE